MITMKTIKNFEINIGLKQLKSNQMSQHRNRKLISFLKSSQLISPLSKRERKENK